MREPAIVTQPRHERHGKTWLLGIDLPRMDVERRWCPTRRRLGERATNDRERKLAQVAATGGGNRHAHFLGRRQRKFVQTTRAATNHVRNPRRSGIAVSAASNRKDAR